MTLTADRTALEHKLIEGFSDFESRLNGESKTALHALRRRAIESFSRTGFPTKKNEDWKYTDLSPLLKKQWKEPQTTDSANIKRTDIAAFLPEGLEANLLVFVNGQLAEHLCDIKESDNTIVLTSFGKALREHSALVEAHFGHYASFEHGGTVALNTAFARNGAFVYVPTGKAAKYPVHLLFLSGNEVMAQIRNLIVVEEGASLSCIESTRSLGNTSSFTNIVTEVVVKSKATVDHYKLQQENEEANQVNLTQVYQCADSLCNNTTISLGGSLLRNDLNFTLDQPHCESHLYGLYITEGEQHMDNHSFVDHAKPNSFSNEFYKGIMMDRSVAIFNGKIMVRPDAQKTNAYQSNKNILLSDEAKVNTKPQLEIFADDVKCSHGATTGQLDAEALFYLRSRGIGQAEAKAMLTYAFAEEVLENIKIEALKQYLDKELEKKLLR